MEQCLLDLTENYPASEFLIVGDLNSRTGCENFIDIDVTDDDALRSNEMDCVKMAHERSSKDLSVNDFGRYLMTVCEEFDMSILNGMIPGDTSGNYTYVAYNGSSVVDYFVLSNRLLALSLSMNVGERIERKHQPIELFVNYGQSSQECVKNNQTQGKEYKVDKLIWDANKEDEFTMAIGGEANMLLLEEACDLIDLNIDQALDKFQQILHSAGSCMKRTLVHGKERKEEWFDAECHLTRKDVRRKLRKFNKSDKPNDRIDYNNKRKEYKELLRVKKANLKQKILDTLNNGTTSPTEFWGKVKTLT